jgi:hypothetical protein
MMKLTPSEPRYSYRTIEITDPMSAEELDEMRLEGWRHIRTNKRKNKRGQPYLQYEFERVDRSVIENRIMSRGENRVS